MCLGSHDREHYSSLSHISTACEISTCLGVSVFIHPRSFVLRTFTVVKIYSCCYAQFILLLSLLWTRILCLWILFTFNLSDINSNIRSVPSVQLKTDIIHKQLVGFYTVFVYTNTEEREDCHSGENKKKLKISDLEFFKKRDHLTVRYAG